MQTFFHSAFLQALGYAIAHSLWQMALLWIIVVLVNSLFRLASRYRYALAVMAQTTGFVWFVVTLMFYYRQCMQAASDAATISATGNYLIGTAASGNVQSKLLSFFVQAEQLLPYLSFAYLLLLLVLGFRWFKYYSQAQQFKNGGLEKIDASWRLFASQLAFQLGIRREVKIYQSTVVKSPLTLGFLKPVILIPVASLNNLTTQQLEAVILHEMAHILRKDYLVNLLLSVVEMMLFFNPFTQLISRQIRKEREHSCDDWVLQYKYQPAEYAEALLKIATLQAVPALAMHAAEKGELLTRVRRMVMKHETRFNYKQQLAAFFLMAGILSSVAWFQPVKEQPVAKQGTEQQLIIEPLAVKVDNPFFNPLSLFNEPLKEEVEKATEAAAQSCNANLYHTVEDNAIHTASITLQQVAPMVATQIERINTPEFRATVTAAAQTGIAQAQIALQEVSVKMVADTLNVLRLIPAAALAKAQEELQRTGSELQSLQFINSAFNFVKTDEFKKITTALSDFSNQQDKLRKMKEQTKQLQDEQAKKQELFRTFQSHQAPVTINEKAKKRFIIELQESDPYIYDYTPADANIKHRVGYEMPIDVESDSFSDSTEIKVTGRYQVKTKKIKTARL